MNKNQSQKKQLNAVICYERIRYANSSFAQDPVMFNLRRAGQGTVIQGESPRSSGLEKTESTLARGRVNTFLARC